MGCPRPASSHPPAFSWPVAPGQMWRRRRVPQDNLRFKTSDFKNIQETKDHHHM